MSGVFGNVYWRPVGYFFSVMHSKPNMTKVAWIQNYRSSSFSDRYARLGNYYGKISAQPHTIVNKSVSPMVMYSMYNLVWGCAEILPITTWEIEITVREWKTVMRDFKLPIEDEKILIEKKTDVARYREVNINCWERVVVAWKEEFIARD